MNNIGNLLVCLNRHNEINGCLGFNVSNLNNINFIKRIWFNGLNDPSFTSNFNISYNEQKINTVPAVNKFYKLL